MIKIFTDIEFLTERYRKFVFPLLFDLFYLKNEMLLQHYNFVTSLEECDIAIVPISIDRYYKEKNEKKLDTFVTEAKKLGKKVWLYSGGDFGLTYSDASVYTFRLGGFHCKMNESTFIMPSFINDPMKDYFGKELDSRPKTNLPIVGFTGNASGGFKKYLKEITLHYYKIGKIVFSKARSDFQGFYPSSIKRFHILNRLQESSTIDTNFIFRKKYRAGIIENKDGDQTRIAYFQNMKESHYILCLRGSGNFSVRFYEALAMGCIPILIDTDVRLPLNTVIDWSKHILILSEKDVSQIGNKISEWHKAISDEAFQQLQISNRNLWKAKLTRDCYFLEIHKLFVS